MNYQVSKKGKPFSKLASDQTSPRMTRESYFKIAETQGLREQAVSYMAISTEDNMETNRKQSHGSFPPTKNGLFMPKEKRNSTNFVSVSVFEAESNATSTSNNKMPKFARRHRSID